MLYINKIKTNIVIRETRSSIHLSKSLAIIYPYQKGQNLINFSAECFLNLTDIFSVLQVVFMQLIFRRTFPGDNWLMFSDAVGLGIERR